MLNLNKIKSLNGTTILPGDKSISHRAMIYASLALGESVIANWSSSLDVIATRDALKQLGVSIITSASGNLKIDGRGGEFTPPDKPIWCANSGTTMRLLMGVLASCDFESELTGDESLSKRPMERVAVPLRNMGAEIYTTDGHAPIRIIGTKNLKPIEYELPIASAQLKSALLLAAAFAKGKSTIIEPVLSRDHTEIAFEQICMSDYKREMDSGVCTHIINGPLNLKPFELSIPSDPSSAGYIIAIALLKPDSKVEFHNMLLNPRRIKYLEILKQMGGDIEIEQTGTKMGEPVGTVIARSSELKNVKIFERDVPLLIDELPLLAQIATMAKGRFEVRGAGELRFKESDRLKAIVENFQRLSIAITEYPDGFGFDGPVTPVKAPVDHYNDHRILMSLMVFSSIHGLDLQFEDMSALAVSFGEFFKYLQDLSD